MHWHTSFIFLSSFLVPACPPARLPFRLQANVCILVHMLAAFQVTPSWVPDVLVGAAPWV